VAQLFKGSCRYSSKGFPNGWGHLPHVGRTGGREVSPILRRRSHVVIRRLQFSRLLRGFGRVLRSGTIACLSGATQ